MLKTNFETFRQVLKLKKELDDTRAKLKEVQSYLAIFKRCPTCQNLNVCQSESESEEEEIKSGIKKRKRISGALSD
jgi:phage FluMu protein Com